MKGRQTAWRVGLGTAILALAAGLFLWIVLVPSEENRLDALAVGAERAVRDLYAQDKIAFNGQPAYYGYVIQGAFDFQAVKSRMADVGVSVLPLDQVEPHDWQKESGAKGWGPTYSYIRKDTRQRAMVVTVELTHCSRFSAEVRISHDRGGVTYRLSRGAGQPWRVVDKKDVLQFVY
jgi:hypothetical protein